jgi:hypothetical protein
MAYMPLVSPLAPKTCDGLPVVSGEAKFTSRISYETAVPGMTLRTILPSYQPPPGLKMITKSKTVSQTATKESPEGKKTPGKPGVLFGAEDADGTQQAEQVPDVSPFSFLQRYWYIILPLMIMNFMSPSQEEPKEGASGQQSGGPVAAAGEGSKRRGKNVK